MRAIMVAAMVLAAAGPVAAQHAQEAATPAKEKVKLSSRLPEGWMGRLDREDADAATVAFTTMAPGWHMTTGPGGIYWRPGQSASGDFTVSSTIFFFKSSGPTEGYGIFVGGAELENAHQTYVYFLLRGDGKYKISRRNGPVVTTIREWTPSEAIAVLTSDAPVKNVLAVRTAGERVEFVVNEQVVETLPRAELHVDGAVGLRINHRLNLHITDLLVNGK